MPKALDPKTVSDALTKALAGELPEIAVAGDDRSATVVLTYPHALYNARTSADTDAIGTLAGWAVARAEVSDVHASPTAPPVTSVVTLELSPAPHKAPIKPPKAKE